MDWRCITGSECKNKRSSFSGESIQDIALFKRYKNTCVASCPPDTKESMTADRTPICEECKDCPKKCNGGLVSSLEVLMKFDGCTDVMGDLIIQLSGCEYEKKKPLRIYRHAANMLLVCFVCSSSSSLTFCL